MQMGDNSCTFVLSKDEKMRRQGSIFYDKNIYAIAYMTSCED